MVWSNCNWCVHIGISIVFTWDLSWIDSSRTTSCCIFERIESKTAPKLVSFTQGDWNFITTSFSNLIARNTNCYSFSDCLWGRFVFLSDSSSWITCFCRSACCARRDTRCDVCLQACIDAHSSKRKVDWMFPLCLLFMCLHSCCFLSVPLLSFRSFLFPSFLGIHARWRGYLGCSLLVCFCFV